MANMQDEGAAQSARGERAERLSNSDVAAARNQGQLHQSAAAQKEQANQLFRAGQFHAALDAYNAILALVPDPPPAGEGHTLRQLLCVVSTNIAQCHISIGSAKLCALPPLETL